MKYHRIKPHVVRAAYEEFKAAHECGNPEVVELYYTLVRELYDATQEVLKRLEKNEPTTFVAVAQDLPVQLPIRNGKLVLPELDMSTPVIVKKNEHGLKQEIRRRQDALRRLRRQH
jgi:hypothetical protein